MNGKLEWLQALRAIAALMVVGFHFRETLVSHQLLPENVGALLQFGFFGVDIFFALSGFVVGRSAHRAISARRDAWSFLLQRFSRIFLGYWPVLLVLYVSMRTVGRAPNPELALQSIFLLSPFHDRNWLNVAWSLTFELYFYLLIAVVFIFVAKPKRLLAVAVLTISLGAWNAFWITTASAGGNAPAFEFFTSALTIEFLLGVLLALFFERVTVSKELLLIAGLALTCAGLSVGVSDQRYADVYAHRAYTYGLAALGVLMIACGVQRTTLFAPTWWVKLGDASFSLYLLHPIALYALGYSKDKGVCGAWITCGSFIVILLSATIVGALLWYHFVEHPIYRHASQALKNWQEQKLQSAQIAS